MSLAPADPQKIREYTEDLLQRADAIDRWPTPVSDILAAAKLEEVEDSPFSESMLGRVPERFRHAARILQSGRVRGILDRKARVVHIDTSIDNEGRRNFIALHEVTHDLLPWQRDLGYADDDRTLATDTRRVFEREANQGSAELLFQGERFAKIAANYAIGTAVIVDLHDTVGASLRATIRRYAETHKHPVCAIVLDTSPCQLGPLGYRRREISQSAAWTKRFGSQWPLGRLTADVFPFLLAARDSRQRDFVWPDIDNELVSLHAEALTTGYNTLLLVWVPRRERLRRKVILAREAA